MINFRDKRIRKLKQAIRDEFAEKYHRKIEICDDYEFTPAFNNRCHYNSCSSIFSGRAVALIECITVDDDEITAHYINQKENGDYIDYTLGYLYAGSDYRLIRVMPTKNHTTPSNNLSNLKSRLCDHHINWFDRRILGIDKWDLV